MRCRGTAPDQLPQVSCPGQTRPGITAGTPDSDHAGGIRVDATGRDLRANSVRLQRLPRIRDKGHGTGQAFRLGDQADSQDQRL